MYQASDLFRKAYSYAIKHCDHVAILSAKYGLVLPDDEIDPYDQTLPSMSVAQQEEWTRRVYAQMKDRLPMGDISNVFFHSGAAYREHLSRLLKADGIQCVAPLKNLGLGKQKAWYMKTEKERQAVIDDMKYSDHG
jgi:hypothetical protein